MKSRSRIARVHRVANAIGVLLLIAVIAGLVYSEFEKARRPGFLSLGLEECRRQLGQAHSAADSARVDLMIPATGGQKGWLAQRCGVLRRSGSLK